MKNYSTLYLKSREDRRLRAGHLWVYSNEIDSVTSPLKNFQAGELVQVKNDRNKMLGIGYINPATLLSVRLLTRHSREDIDETFFVTRIQKALQLRQMIFPEPYYRLIYAESDSLPGLIVDRYGDILVVQITTAGMEKLLDFIIAALKKNLNPRGILLRNDSAIRQLEGLENYVKVIYGDVPEMIELVENGVKFHAPLQGGQKTGWFYDHRDNRARLKRYVKNKRVLDVFSYIGGWGIQAAVFGAKTVTCIDSSAVAIKQSEQNAVLNQVDSIVNTITEDAFQALKQLIDNKEKFDVIILDPPAFIKKRKDQETGEAAYQRLNEMALQCLSDGGILMTASCSLHLPTEKLADIVRRASLNLNRPLQIIERGFQGPDHPVHPAISETAYLKLLICSV